MKSPLIENAKYISEHEKKLYSELQILQSNAGWYIGTVYNNPDGFQEPGSRDSQYFLTKEDAEEFMKYALPDNYIQEFN